MDIGVCDGVAERMGVEVRRGVSAAELTTFRGGGEAARVYVPRSAERAAEFAAECARLGAEFFVLGDALSNACRPDALIWMKCAKEPLPRGGAY